MEYIYIHFKRRVLRNSIDSTEENRGPIPNYRRTAAFFYIFFFIVFPFFFVNIFVALIIITFQEQGEAELLNENLTKNQVCSSMFRLFHFVFQLNYLLNAPDSTRLLL